MPSHPHHAESRFFNVAVALTHAMEELPPAYPWSGDSILSSLRPNPVLLERQHEALEALLGEYHGTQG